MTTDATATRQLAAEPHPDSRGSAFARVRAACAEGVHVVTSLLPEKIDARTLWVPLTAALVLFLGAATTLVGVTVWLTNLSHRADTATTLAAAIEDLTKAQARQEGKIDTLVSMQGDLARTTAEISGLKSRLDAQDRRLETMDAWIQTTRDRLQEQGFRGVPDYKPGGAP